MRLPARRAPGAEERLLAVDPDARRWLRLAIASGFLAALLGVAAALLSCAVIAGVFMGGQGLPQAMPLLAMCALLAGARAGCVAGQEILAQRSSSALRGTLRAALTGHLRELGPAWAAGERSGELASVVGGGLQDVDLYVTTFRPARWLAALVPAMVLLVVLLLDPLSALVLVLSGPVLLLLLAVIGGRARVVTALRFEEMRWLGAFFLDMLQGMATLKTFGRSGEQVENIRDISRHLGDTTMDVLRTAFQTALVLEWGGTVATAVVAVEVSLRLIAGQMPFERALSVLVVTPEFFLPLRQLAIRYHAGFAGRAAAERIFAVLDEPVGGRQLAMTRVVAPALVPPPPPWIAPVLVPAPAPAPDVRRLLADGGIRFADVWHTYEGRRPALRGLSLTIPAGRMVALAGVSGAGKTTCANLLLRFIEPDGGRIMIGETALDVIDRAAWLAAVAWVPQRPFLFHGSVSDNIRLGRPEAGPDEVRSAALQAGADAFILALPQGYETPLGEGGQRLSGGQRQRIAIARAFLRDAALVILDEPTSHLDAAAEMATSEALGRLVLGRTTLVISHQLRLASLADTVVVLEDGRATQAGRAAELLAQDGAYRRVVAGLALLGAPEAMVLGV